MFLAYSPAPLSISLRVDTIKVKAANTILDEFRTPSLSCLPIFFIPTPKAPADDPPARRCLSISPTASLASKTSPKIGILEIPFNSPPATPNCLFIAFSFPSVSSNLSKVSLYKPSLSSITLFILFNCWKISLYVFFSLKDSSLYFLPFVIFPFSS